MTAALMLSLSAGPVRAASIAAALPSTAVSGADDLWHNQPVILTFAASDPGGPGIAYTEYSLDGGSTWAQGDSVTVTAPSDHSNDGSHTVLYRSVDKAGTAEAPNSATVRIDTGGPTTIVGGLPSGCVNHPVTLGFSASDALSRVAFTQYSINGGAWTQGNSLTISTAGSTTVSYCSADNAGNGEAASRATLRIDTSIPTATLYAATVRQGGTAKLHFRIGDAPPSCGAASLTIAIARGHRTLKTIHLASVHIGKRLATDYRCPLSPGRYRMSLSATDLAGNKGKPVSAVLVVAPVDQRVERAIAWALAQRGSHSWDFLCLEFVNDAYQSAGVSPQRLPSAIDAARALGASSQKGVPPRGAYVFYWHPPDGHVGLSLGGGQIVHAFGVHGVIVSDYLRIRTEYPDIHMSYIGWALPKTSPQVNL